ncbi:MAG TPA: hypothetical protein VMT87_05980 [Vicinamibacteria bacterium]|nr:hypothetical protein [Vicinamibacteria bacterium]
MRFSGPAPWLLGLAALVPSTAGAHLPPREEVGSLVSVSLDVAGRPAPLFRAPDGSGRYYVEARPRAGYALRLANRTGERLGVVITVDGLNAVSGDRAAGAPGFTPPGRMYVLGPWDAITVRGWRTSLDEVRRFTFVDERRSYAARSGQANAKMGWIEVAVHRERRPVAEVTPRRGGREMPSPESGRDESAAPRSYPGTGWGAPAHDPATLVDFDPQPHPGERVTLRYEYAPGLRALGIDVRPRRQAPDRLRERDRAEGFAKPPA